MGLRGRARVRAHRPARPPDARPRARTRPAGPVLTDVRPHAVGRAIQAGSPVGLPGAVITPPSGARLPTRLGCPPALREGGAPAALDGRTRSGKWSVRENLAHLARHHQVMLDRVRKV